MRRLYGVAVQLLALRVLLLVVHVSQLYVVRGSHCPSLFASTSNTPQQGIEQTDAWSLVILCSC